MRNLRYNPRFQARWCGLMVGGLAAILGASIAQATPYATSLTNNAGLVSFRLNEAADDIKVIGNAGALTNALGALPAGLTVTNLAGSGMGAGTFSVVVQKSGAGAPTGISTNSLSALRGIAVNIYPNSPNFGRVYAAAATASSSAGVYVYAADTSNPFTPGSNQRTGGYDWVTSSGNAKPFHLSVAPNGQVFISDWTDASGNLIVTDPDVTAFQYVLKQLSGSAAIPVGSNNVHGSVQAVAAVGSTNTGDLVVYTVDEDYQQDPSLAAAYQMNSLWEYDIGAGPLPWNNPPSKLLAVPSVDFVSQNDDVARGPTGLLYYNQRRANASGPPGTGVFSPSLYIVNPAVYIDYTNYAAVYDPTNQPGVEGCLTLCGNYWPHTSIGGWVWDSQSASTDLGSGGSDYLLDINGIGVSPDGKYIAGILYSSPETIIVVPCTNGIPDLSQRFTISTGAGAAAGRSVAWDAADNVYIASSGLGQWRAYSLGITATATTTSDGTFNLVTPNATVSAASPAPVAYEAGPVAGQFTVSRAAPDMSLPVPVHFNMGGTAARGNAAPSDYLLKTNGVVLTGNIVTIPAGANSITIDLVPIQNSLPQPTLTAVFTLTGGGGYLVNPGAASATVSIVDMETPQIRMALSTNIYEGNLNDYARLTLTRWGDTNQQVILDTPNFVFGGTAVKDVDYYITNLPVYLDPGVVTTSIPFIYPLKHSTAVGSLSIQVTNIASPTFTVSNNTATAYITLQAVPPETVLWSDDFETDTTANYRLFFATTNGAPEDYTALFNYDYTVGWNAVPPVPAAPHSTGTDTHGLLLTVNKWDTLPAAAALNLYPIGKSFSGNFALRFDMYLWQNSISGTTEYALFGINHSGTKTNWFRNSGTGVDPGAAFDGLFYDIESDGAGLGDYVLYSGPVVTNAGVIDPTTLASRNATTLTDVLKSPPYTPGAGGGGSPANLPSTFTPSWAEVEIAQIGNVVTLKLNNSPIITYTNNGSYTSGDVMLGYVDAYDSIGNGTPYAGEACVIYDNVRVVQLSPPTVTGPSNVIAGIGTNVTFAVTATTITGVTNYQWLFNGAPIAGASGSSYSFGVLTNSFGNYSVNVSDGAYVTRSATATLLPPLPIINIQPVSHAGVRGSSTTFSVDASTFSGVTNYQWQHYGTNLSGKTTKSLTLTNLQTASFGPYLVNIRDGTANPAVASVTVQLTQAAAPTVTSSFSGTTLTLSFGSEVGPTYVVEYKQNLSDPTWTTLSTNAGTGGTLTVTDTLTLPSRFYRIRAY